MKKYNSVLLEDEEVQVLLKIAQLNDILVVPSLFPGDIETALDNFSFRDNLVFYHENNHVVGLYFNRIKMIKLPQNFGKLLFLRFLEFYKCSFDKFPTSFNNLYSLEQLDFINDPEISPITDIDLPNNFGELKKLNKLKIYGMFNVYLPPSFFELEHLKELYLAYCLFSPNRSNFMVNCGIEEPEDLVKYVHEFHEDLSKLKSLKTLILAHLELEKVPSSLRDLKNLSELDMSFSNRVIYTELKNIDVVFELNSLEKLNLSYSMIKSIPRTIGNLTRLKDLDMSWNDLKEIPVEIKNCKQLEKLSITNMFYKENIKTWIKSLIPLRNLHYLAIGKSDHEFLPKELTEKQDLIIE